MIVFIDTETTGLPLAMGAPLSLQPRMIEIYVALTNDKGEIKKELDTLIDPRIPIPDFITRITHIDQVMVASAPRFANIYKKLNKLLAKADTIVAHNLAFDKTIIEVEYAHLEETAPIPDNLFCTVEQSMHIKGFRLKLQELHKLATGLDEIPGAHRAKNDVKAMITCWKWLRKQEKKHGLD